MILRFSKFIIEYSTELKINWKRCKTSFTLLLWIARQAERSNKVSVKPAMLTWRAVDMALTIWSTLCTQIKPDDHTINVKNLLFNSFTSLEYNLAKKWSRCVIVLSETFQFVKELFQEPQANVSQVWIKVLYGNGKILIWNIAKRIKTMNKIGRVFSNGIRIRVL